MITTKVSERKKANVCWLLVGRFHSLEHRGLGSLLGCGMEVKTKDDKEKSGRQD